MDVLERLVQKIPPPSDARVIHHDWERVEQELGTRLPSDYKRLIEVYGPGSFDDFLHVYHPNSPWKQLDLKHEAEGELRALRYLRDMGAKIPYRLNEPAELLAFGRNENGDLLFWHRRDSQFPETWSVAVKEGRAIEWFTYGGNMTSFLYEVLLKKISVPIFPEGFPSEHPSFASYSDI